jgi:hypothetical protein
VITILLSGNYVLGGETVVVERRKIMEIINTSAQTEQVGGNWYYCTPICAGTCIISPAMVALGVASYSLF